MLRDSCGGLQLASGSSAVRFRRSRFTANGSGCPCERTGPMELMGLMWGSRSCSPRIFGGRLQNVIRPPGYFLPAVLSFLREAAWSSQGWDTAIRVSSFITLRLDRFPLPNTLQFKPEGQRDT